MLTHTRVHALVADGKLTPQQATTLIMARRQSRERGRLAQPARHSWMRHLVALGLALVAAVLGLRNERI